MWFELAGVDLDFTTTSPKRIVNEALALAPPERVFDVMVDADSLRSWFTDVVDVRWTSDPPYGVGSTRDVKLKLLSVRERFLAWERGARLTFAMTHITLPIARRLMEDLRLEREGERRTRIVWTAHYEPTPWARPLEPLFRRIFDEMFKKALRGLVEHAETSI